jgi:hypothetical protein
MTFLEKQKFVAKTFLFWASLTHLLDKRNESEHTGYAD